MKAWQIFVDIFCSFTRLKAKVDSKLISDFVASLELLCSPELVWKVSIASLMQLVCRGLASFPVSTPQLLFSVHSKIMYGKSWGVETGNEAVRAAFETRTVYALYPLLTLYKGLSTTMPSTLGLY